MKTKLIHILAALCLATPRLLAADPVPVKTPADYKAMRAEVEALVQLTQPPKAYAADRADSTPNLKAIYFDGPDYQGRPTKVFAWLGIPEKREGKIPAVVLLHGGGGTASKGWVKNWTEHGYAAISMSLEGHTDQYDEKLKSLVRNPDGGPTRPGIFGDSAAPIRDQWMYQCVAIAELSAALLRSLPEVNPDKIGIVGCSWGGIITTTVIGIDPRYAFAIPVYGCGGLDAIPNHYGANLANNEVYKNVWDSNLRLDRANMPILWLSWPQDAHFPMDAFTLSRKKKVHGASVLCLVPGMGHGNLTDRPDWFAFAESVLKEGRPWIIQTSSKLEAGKIQAAFDSTKPLDSAVLVSTTDSGITGSRKWIESPAAVKKDGNLWVAEAALPKGTTVCFINVKSGQLTASSDYHEVNCAAIPIGAMVYPDGRPSTALRMDAKDQGVVLKHGDGPGQCDYLGAREALIFEENEVYHLFYDGAGPKGWLACLATSKDLKTWEKKGPVLDFGKPGENDSASASSPWVYRDGKEWHMFYLGTPHASPAPNFIPFFPYQTMKAKSPSLAGPWIKQPEVVPFSCKPNTYYDVTASPGHIVKQGDEYLMFFSAAGNAQKPKRTLSIARTKDINGPWAIDPQPIFSPEEQIENSSLCFEPTNKTWFLFTNHIGLDGGEYTDAVWVYWSKDLNKWDPANKAVVLDGKNCTWSKKCIGMPSVVKVGNRLAVFYDAPGGKSTSHMGRDIGLAWLELPLSPPAAQDSLITVASYYFGNYHPGDPRNVKSKGKDWSEWELVKAAKPRFPGHQQPKVPLWGYTDDGRPR